MDDSRGTSGISLAELLGAFSMATDLGLGQPMEHLLRSWQIAARLGPHAGLTDEQGPELFYVAMLAWVGCVADAIEVADSFGDDIEFRADSYDVDLGGLSGLAFFLGHAGAGRSAGHRLLAGVQVVASGGRKIARGIQSHCLTTSTLSDTLGLGPEVSTALRQFFARWDGGGVPRGLGGTDLALSVRLFHLGDVVEVHHRRGGVAEAVKVARARSGKQFDPAVVDAFCRHADDVLPGAGEHTDAHHLIAADPALSRSLSESELDAALEALADFTDLRSPMRAGHSRGVADLARAAALRVRLPADGVVALRRAGLLHDIGLHGVPSTILDKKGPLTFTEQERLQAGAYYTGRVLARPLALNRIGAIAGLSHERMDGSGFPHGLSGPGIPMAGRLLAAACAYRTLAEPREARDPLTPPAIRTTLDAEARAGRLSAEAVDAVLGAAQGGKRRPTTGPAGLTAREVEVLHLIARGTTTKEVARALAISPKTAGTHIERIYMKTGATSRSTVTLFALRHGLLDPLDA